MELEGLNSEGKRVKTSVMEFAKANAKETEDIVGVGQTPYSVVYLDRGTQKTREADMRQLATLAGINDVQFRFDRKMAKEANLLVEKDVDQGIAYNLERIKTRDGKDKYLQSKGVQGFFHDGGGDDYFTIQGGKIIPLNNKDGFDLSDLTRMGAHAGRDVGALAGVAATGVGAAATGGASLAVAGAAGATGAMAGEWVQRGIDKALGVEADKFNKDLTAGQEAKEALTEAGIGAITSVGGQYVTKGLGKLGVEGTKALAIAGHKTGIAEEWLAKQAAKTEAGYLAAKMPSGWMKGFLGNNSEEAVAKELLEKARIGKTYQEAKTALDDAKAVKKDASDLARGSGKPLPGQVDEAALREQQALREQARFMEEQAKKAQEKKLDYEYADKETIKERFAVYKERMTQNAMDVFSKEKNLVEEILKEGGDLETATKAMSAIDNKVFSGLKSKGIAIETDSAGTVSGLNRQTSQAYIQKTLDQAISESSDFVSQKSLQALDFNKVPSDGVRSSTTSAINQMISAVKGLNVDDKMKERIAVEGRNLIKAINRHDTSPGDDVAFQINKFMEFSRGVADSRDLPPSFHNLVRSANENLYKYASEGSTRPNAVKDMADLQEAVLAVRATRRNQVFDQEGGTEHLLRQLSDLQVMTGESPKAANDIAVILHLEDVLANNPKSKYWAYMNDADKARMNAWQLLRSEVVSKKQGATKEGSKFGVGMLAGMAFEVAMTGGSSPGLIAGAIAGEGVSNIMRSQTAKTGAKALGKAAAGAAKGAIKAATSPKFQRTAAYYGVAEAAEQKRVGNMLQNWMSTGNNED